MPSSHSTRSQAFIARSTIQHVRLYAYRLPLLRQLQYSVKRMRVRHGFFIELEDAEGRRGLGEVSYLPGFHPQIGYQIRLELLLTLQMIHSGDINLFQRTSDMFPIHWKWKVPVSPLIRFALDQAFLHLLCQQHDTPLSHIWNGKPHLRIPTNALLNDLNEQAVFRCMTFREEGYPAIKIKVGRKPFRQEIRLLEDIRSALGDQIQLRLDANRRWELEAAIAFGKAVAPLNIEYIEEPLRDPRMVPQFYEATGIPVALDESIGEARDVEKMLLPGVQAIVFKPEFFGELSTTYQLIKRVQQRGIRPILSCSFYTGYTLATLVQLASAWIDDLSPQGLSTFLYFKQDILETSLRPRGGAFFLTEVIDHQYQVNRNMLTLIRSGI
ncbi:MAG: o-succinylbenzoate synthase [Calditrichaeota bacterium]|nr:o-succinylbenzoate synthase [Calditrichota bacterium]